MSRRRTWQPRDLPLADLNGDAQEVVVVGQRLQLREGNRLANPRLAQSAALRPNDCQFRVWQHRFYPFGIYREKKRLEKLNYMHSNPLQQGLVSSPQQWPWSSFRFYHLNDSSILSMDRLT